MTTLHAWLGTGLVTSFAVLTVVGFLLRVLRRDEAPAVYWAAQHWTENLLLVQTVGGVILLLLGRRVPPTDLSFLHYLYGSLFPLVAMVGGRLAAMRRETRGYVGLAWGAFFAFGLTLRAVQIGCAGTLDLGCLL